MKEYNNVKMSSFTTWKVGAIAKLFFILESIDDIRRVFERYNPYILGNGSNILVEKDIDVVVKLDQTFLSAQNVHSLCKKFALQQQSGLEFLMGIPATVGGAIKTNAGGKYGTMGDVIETVTIFDSDIKIIEPKFHYRTSNIQGIILDATFRTKKDSTNNILERMNAIIDEKKLTQPLNENTAGCVFKNPKEGATAAQIIERCGLKGSKIGGAMISTKHANFIVTEHGAQPLHIIHLIKLTQNIVFDMTGYNLELEIQIW